MAYGTRVGFEPVREVAFGSVTGSYTAVGAATTDHARIIHIVSTLSTDVYISIDGFVDHLRIAGGGFVLFDFSTNKIHDDGLFLKEGTIFYVKQTSAGAPASGNLWIEVVYGQGGV